MKAGTSLVLFLTALCILSSIQGEAQQVEKTILSFTRPLTKADDFDRAISTGNIWIIWAYKDSDPSTPTQIQYHDERGQLQVNFYDESDAGTFLCENGQSYDHFLKINDAYDMFWTINSDNEIKIAAQVKTSGWVGIGFSPDGKMASSDITLGWKDGQNEYGSDMWAQGHGMPAFDKDEGGNDNIYDLRVLEETDECMDDPFKLVPGECGCGVPENSDCNGSSGQECVNPLTGQQDSPVKCFADPCDTSTCPQYPGAYCAANYCGGCHALFYKGGAPAPGQQPDPDARIPPDLCEGDDDDDDDEDEDKEECPEFCISLYEPVCAMVGSTAPAVYSNSCEAEKAACEAGEGWSVVDPLRCNCKECVTKDDDEEEEDHDDEDDDHHHEEEEDEVQVAECPEFCPQDDYAPVCGSVDGGDPTVYTSKCEWWVVACPASAAMLLDPEDCQDCQDCLKTAPGCGTSGCGLHATPDGGGCYCDAECHLYGDCCEDVCDSCDHAFCNPASCSFYGCHKLGAQQQCQCDEVCFQMGDCCEDVCQPSACGNVHTQCKPTCAQGGATPFGGDHGGGMCGLFVPGAECQCYDGCERVGNCCHDVCDACGDLPFCKPDGGNDKDDDKDWGDDKDDEPEPQDDDKGDSDPPAMLCSGPGMDWECPPGYTCLCKKASRRNLRRLQFGMFEEGDCVCVMEM